MSTLQSRILSAALALFVGSVGAYTMLLGLSPELATEPLGLVLLGAAVVFALLTVVGTVRQGGQVARAVIGLAVLGVLMAALVYGSIWFFTIYQA